MTKDQIIEIVKKHMEAINLDFDHSIGFTCSDKQLKILRDDTTKEIYTVTFRTPDRGVEYDNEGNLVSLIEGYYCFCKIDASNYKILYYVKPHGYIELDGTGHWV